MSIQAQLSMIHFTRLAMALTEHVASATKNYHQNCCPDGSPSGLACPREGKKHNSAALHVEAAATNAQGLRICVDAKYLSGMLRSRFTSQNTRVYLGIPCAPL